MKKLLTTLMLAALLSLLLQGAEQSATASGAEKAVPSQGFVRVRGQQFIDPCKFTCSWKEDPAVTAPTRIYLPRRIFTSREYIQLRPLGVGFTVETVGGAAEHVHLVIPPAEGHPNRTLTVN